MKRPILIAALFVLTGAVGAMCCNLIFTLIAGAIELGIIIFLCRFQNLHLFSKIYLVVCVISMLCVYAQTIQQKNLSFYEKSLEMSDGRECELQGYVRLILKKTGYIQIYMSNCHVNVTDTEYDRSNVEMASLDGVGIVVSINEFSGFTGDLISVKGKLQCFDSPRNEGEFDTRTYYHSIGMDYACKGRKIEIEKTGKNELNRVINRLQNKVEDGFLQVTDEKKAGVLSSIILGDKQNLDSDIKRIYQTSGIAHILAISGLHISILGMTLYRLLRRWCSFLPSAVCSMTIMITYLLMTGNGISAFRAVVMFIIAMIAEILGRTYDTKTALASAAILLITQNGRVICNSGFQLSFCAVIGVAFLFSHFSNGLNPFQKKTWKANAVDAVLMSISIQLSTLPVVLSSYFQIPTFGFILNLIVIPLMTLVMVGGILSGLWGFFSLGISTFFMGISYYILDFYEYLCGFYNRIPGAIVVMGKPKTETVIIYMGVLIVCLYMMKRVKRRKIRFIMTFVVLLIGILQLKRRPTSELLINMIDVGQGDSIFVETKKGNTYLFDGGSTDIKQVGTKRIMPFLKSQGVSKIDYVLISHSDSDHINGIIEMIELDDSAFTIGKIIVPDIVRKDSDENYQHILKTAREHGIEVSYSLKGSQLNSGDGVKVHCFHPGQNYSYESPNDYSAVYLLSYGKFKMLFTGDAEKRAEEAIISDEYFEYSPELYNINILKVGHHGSNSSTSSEWLKILRPDVALISCGVDNSYGHPHKETLEHLSAMGVHTYITSQAGAIQVNSDGNTYSIQSFLQTK